MCSQNVGEVDGGVMWWRTSYNPQSLGSGILVRSLTLGQRIGKWKADLEGKATYRKIETGQHDRWIERYNLEKSWGASEIQCCGSDFPWS